MTVTEICIFPIKAGTFDSDPAKSDYEDGMQIALSQPGCQRILEGFTIEDADKVVWLVDWETLEAHKAFEKEKSYKPFLQQIGQYFIPGERPSVFHINLPIGPKGEASAGEVTAVSIIDIKPGKLETAVGEFDRMAGSEEGPRGLLYGTGIETENQVVVFSHWNAPEDHKAYGARPGNAAYRALAATFMAGVTGYHVRMTKRTKK